MRGASAVWMAVVRSPYLFYLVTWNAILMLDLLLVVKFKIFPRIEKQDTRDTQNACIQYMYVFIYMCVCVCCVLYIVVYVRIKCDLI